MASRYVIENATVNNIEQKQGQNGAWYLLHITIPFEGRNGQSFPKVTTLACFDAQAIMKVAVGGTYNITGKISVNKQNYLNLSMGDATQVSAPAQAAQQAPAQHQYAPMPSQAAPQSQTQAPHPQAPKNDFDDDIPF